MPSKTVIEVIARLVALELKMEAHLIESGGIKSDLKWLKWFMMAIIGGLIGLFFKR
jgi:hypothetical protein